MSSKKAYLFLLSASVIWAGNMTMGKLAAGHITPTLLTTVRWTLALILITAISVKPVKQDWPVIKRHLPLLLGYGAFGYGVYNVVLYSALTYTSAINVLIEHAATPLVIFLINFALFKVRATWAQIAGFGLTLIGVLVTASHGDFTTLLHLKLNQGDALVGLCILLYGAYTVSLRYKPDVQWQSLLFVSVVGALLACIPFMMWEYRQSTPVWPDAIGWTVIIYSAILVSLLSQILFIWGVEDIGANRAGIFINLVPIFGVILSVLFLKEPLHSFHILALVLVGAGVVLSEYGRPKPV